MRRRSASARARRYDPPMHAAVDAKPARLLLVLGSFFVTNALLAEFGRLRKEAGREHLPFETVIGLKTPPDLATFQRLADAGMTGGVSYPFSFTAGQRSTLARKKQVMEEFAERIIRRFN